MSETDMIVQDETRTLRWLAWVGGAVLVAAILAALSLQWVLTRMQPMIRERVIAQLSARFHAPVELDRLEISMRPGIMVIGGGLRIPYADRAADEPPMLTVDSFQFSTGWRQLLEPTTHVVSVHVQGLRLNVSPRQHRAPGPSQLRTRWNVVVDKFECTDATVTLETSNPAKKPLVFQIRTLQLTDVGQDKPFRYDAVLVNPKPVGDVASRGVFGPWAGANPRDTPLAGDYAFTHADLSTIHGIGGILASTGRFQGTLGTIVTAGIADVPDFHLDVSDHPMLLHVDFHATVDGMSGDTRLNQVQAVLGRSYFSATGAVTRMAGVPGHNTDLDVTMNRGRIEDSLTLALKASPPLMRGAIAMHAHIVVPPGPVSVSRKMRLDGRFTIADAFFSDQKLQQKVDEMSMRAQGRPQLANAQGAVVVGSTLSGTIAMHNAVVDVPDLAYAMPGAKVHMVGSVNLVPSTFDFRGTVSTEATASQMTTGWKSMLLQPFDKMLKKNGAGLELPVHVTGDHTTYNLTLDFPHSTTAPARVTGMPR